MEDAKKKDRSMEKKKSHVYLKEYSTFKNPTQAQCARYWRALGSSGFLTEVPWAVRLGRGTHRTMKTQQPRVLTFLQPGVPEVARVGQAGTRGKDFRGPICTGLVPPRVRKTRADTRVAGVRAQRSGWVRPGQRQTAALPPACG